MSDEINKQIAQALQIEHIEMQEMVYKYKQNDDPYFGRREWYTLWDGDELFGEIFPRDWEHNLVDAWTLLPKLTPETQQRVRVRLLFDSAENSAKEICTQFLLDVGFIGMMGTK